MGTVIRSVWTDDSGGGVDGSIVNDGELQKIYDGVDLEVRSPSFPAIKTRSILDNHLAGLPWHFGGAATGGRGDTAFPAGSGGNVLAPNTRIYRLDSVLTGLGTYRLEAMLAIDNAASTVSLALINLTDASTTPLVTIVSQSTVGALVQSAPIVFAVAGVSKDYGVKLITSNAAHLAYAWGIGVRRTG